MKSHMTDIPLFRLWLENNSVLSDSSVYTYVKSIERFVKDNPNLKKINDYNDFLIKLTIKKRSTHYYYALRKFVEFKINDSNLKKNILNSMVKPRMRFDTVRERRHLSEQQIYEVINLLEEKHRIIALIQNITGVRIGDILKLRRDDILSETYKDKPVVRFNITGKGGRKNTVFIHDMIAQNVILNYTNFHFNHEDYSFLELGKTKNRYGQTNNEDKLIKMNYWWYWANLKEALQSTGINKKDFATHDFRRCFARRAWEINPDIHRLQSLLNHSDPKVTLRYLEQSGLKNIDYHYEMQN